MGGGASAKRVVQRDVLVVGIDVAKGWHIAAFRRADGWRLGRLRFSNDRSGFERLLEQAEYLREGRGCRSVAFALEATGHYGHALQGFLTERGHLVLRVNPAHTKRAKELEDNSPEKSDPKDAEVIADLAAQGKARLAVFPQGVYADLRRLAKLRERLVGERTRVRNRYLGLIDLIFPELPTLVRDPAGRSILQLLARCPTPAAIVNHGVNQLQLDLHRWSRGHFRADCARRIHEAAISTVGISEGLAAAQLELRQTMESLVQVERRLREVEQAQADTLAQVPYADLLRSVPGLGVVTVATILGETGDLRQYRDADAVIKFAGYNLYTIASGRQRGRTQITRRGRPLLRRHLFLAACRLCKTGAPLSSFRRRLFDRKPGPVVMVGGCRKLLRLLVAIVRDGKPYEPGRLGVPTAA